MKKLNQAGLAGTAVVLIIVLLLAIGGVGYYVWQTKERTEKTFEKAGNVQDEPQQTTQKYLEIKEMGIKIGLNDATKDAYYVMSKTQPKDVARLSLESLKNVDDCAAEKGGVATIVKLRKEDEAEGTDKTYAEAQSSNIKIMGDVGYLVSRAQVDCSSNPDVQKKLESLYIVFPRQAKTIEAL